MNTENCSSHSHDHVQAREVMNLSSRQDLWGVGQAWLGSNVGGPIAYPVSHADILADTAWFETKLEQMGAQPGDVGYVGYMNDQVTQYWPLFMACVSLGLPLATGMDLRFDAGRFEMFLRQLPIKFAFGISSELLIGMKSAGYNVTDVLKRSQNLVVMRDAWDEIDALGLPHWRSVMLGPIIALESPLRDGFAFDNKEWNLTSHDGHLLISGHPARASLYRELDTGLQGQLVQVDSEWRVKFCSS